MKIRVRLSPRQEPEAALLKLAGISAVVHIVALIVFSVLPRFAQPPAHRPRVLIGQVVTASSVIAPPKATPPATRRAGPTPSERAAEAKRALQEEQKKKKPPPKPEPKPDPTVPPLAKKKRPPEKKPEPAVEVPSPPVTDAVEEEDSSDITGAEAESPIVSFGGEGSDDRGIPWIGSSAFPYDYYRASLVAILQSNWRRPVSPGRLAEPLRCAVKFTIFKTGDVQNVSLVEPSGNTALDLSAQRAVLVSDPLPPLPFQYGNASVSAVVYFELTDE